MRYRWLLLKAKIYFTLEKIGADFFKKIPLSAQKKYVLKSLIQEILSVDNIYLKIEDWQDHRSDIHDQKILSELRVMIDVQPLKNATLFRGIGRYALSLTKYLAIRNPEVNFLLYYTNIGKKGNIDLLDEEIKSWSLDNVKLIFIDVFLRNKILTIYEAQENLGQALEKMDPTHLLTVAGFHFSAPIFHLRLDESMQAVSIAAPQSKSTPASSLPIKGVPAVGMKTQPASKKISIICIKGKDKKVVVGSKCPAGYKAA
jgi:hypothetical protein